MKNSSNLFEHISENLVEYNYGGEGQKYCLQCGESIEEGDMVILEVFKFNNKQLATPWHPLCWKKALEENEPDAEIQS